MFGWLGGTPAAQALGRRPILLATVLFTAWMLGACLAPTLPLPPPNSPHVSPPNNEGFVRIVGEVTPRATVYAVNNRTDKGVSQNTGSDGGYDLELRAVSGDVLRIWEKVGNQDSDFREVTVPDSDIGDGIPPAPIGIGGAK